jgi:hypothetical protein
MMAAALLLADKLILFDENTSVSYGDAYQNQQQELQHTAATRVCRCTLRSLAAPGRRGGGRTRLLDSEASAPRASGRRRSTTSTVTAAPQVAMQEGAAAASSRSNGKFAAQVC